MPSCAPHRHTTLVGWHRHRQLSAGKGRNHLATSVATNSRWHRPHCFAAVPLELRCCLRFDGSINAFEHARDGPGDPHALALVVLQGCSPGKGPCLCPCPLRRCRAGYCASGTWPYCDSGGGRSVSCRHHRLSQLWAHVRVTRYEVRGRSEDDRPRLWLREVTRARGAVRADLGHRGELAALFSANPPARRAVTGDLRTNIGAKTLEKKLCAERPL